MQPVIRLVAYESRDPAAIFVAVPNERGRYVYTHRCVAFVPCDRCKATTGEPCHTRGNYTGGVHYVRRIRFRGLVPSSQKPEDVIGPKDADEDLDFPPLEPA